MSCEVELGCAAGVCVLQGAGKADCEARVLGPNSERAGVGRVAVHQRRVLEAAGAGASGRQQPGLHQAHAAHLLNSRPSNNECSPCLMIEV
jgi:hypothetical protein